MAKPPRQSGRRVTFTKEAAERIAKAVRTVERGDRSIAAAAGQRQVGDDALVRGTFTGTWAKGQTTDVTDATLSYVTYRVTNYTATLPPPAAPMGCMIAYVAGEWVLVNWDWTALPNYDAEKQQVLTHTANGGLKWVNTTACT